MESTRHLRTCSDAIASAATTANAEIVCNATVKRILYDPGMRRATGVLMEDGTELRARTIISGATPYHTFLELLPELRLAFSTLTAQETARIARHVARRHDPAPATAVLDAGDAAALRAVMDDLAAQGLGGWLALADGGGP